MIVKRTSLNPTELESIWNVIPSFFLKVALAMVQTRDLVVLIYFLSQSAPQTPRLLVEKASMNGNSFVQLAVLILLGRKPINCMQSFLTKGLSIHQSIVIRIREDHLDSHPYCQVCYGFPEPGSPPTPETRRATGSSTASSTATSRPSKQV